MEGPNGFQVRSKNADATVSDLEGFSICTQAQRTYEFFALVESIRGG